MRIPAARTTVRNESTRCSAAPRRLQKRKSCCFSNSCFNSILFREHDISSTYVRTPRQANNDPKQRHRVVMLLVLMFVLQHCCCDAILTTESHLPWNRSPSTWRNLPPEDPHRRSDGASPLCRAGASGRRRPSWSFGTVWKAHESRELRQKQSGACALRVYPAVDHVVQQQCKDNNICSY